MKIALVAPHIFMQDKILSRVIFSPGFLVIDLANELTNLGHEVTLFTPGQVATKAQNQTADLTLLQAELDARGDDELSLLRKHPLTFISLARAVQAELIASAFERANDDQFDVVHVYMNEEELGLSFRKLCTKPVVFTHHDPFNFTAKYRSIMPKHTDANWISMSLAQRKTMPENTNWVGNVYHGLPDKLYVPVSEPTKDYLLYIGRIIEPKGVHLAIEAVREHNKTHSGTMRLKIAGKHYSGQKDSYWQKILPSIDGQVIEYVGFVNDLHTKNELIGNAAGLIIPSVFDEPFGMVMIEALACGTPIIGLGSGAIPEVVKNNRTGFLAKKVFHGDELDVVATTQNLVKAIGQLHLVDRQDCRNDFESRFTLRSMAESHAATYEKLM